MPNSTRAFATSPAPFIVCEVQTTDAFAAAQLENIQVSAVTYRASAKTANSLTFDVKRISSSEVELVILRNYKMLRLARAEHFRPFVFSGQRGRMLIFRGRANNV